MIGAITIVISVAGFLAILSFALEAYLPDVGRAKDVAGAVQAGVTAVAISAAAVFAAVKLQMFRDFEPHLTISHEVSHRPVGDRYVHIGVTAALRNSSRVMVELRRGYFLLQQIAPVSDEEVEFLYSQAFGSKEHQDIQWETLENVPRVWDKGALIVEPGETHPETCEFIISATVKSVIIYTYIYNPRFSHSSSRPEGWVATTFYGLSDRGED